MFSMVICWGCGCCSSWESVGRLLMLGKGRLIRVSLVFVCVVRFLKRVLFGLMLIILVMVGKDCNIWVVLVCIKGCVFIMIDFIVLFVWLWFVCLFLELVCCCVYLD